MPKQGVDEKECGDSIAWKYDLKNFRRGGIFRRAALKIFVFRVLKNPA